MEGGVVGTDVSSRGKSAADALLRRSPLQLAFRARAAARLVVLAYHAVPDRAVFARHVAYLRRVRTPVTIGDVLAHLYEGRPFPPRPVLVTFDDGHPSLVDVALPVLGAAGVPAVAFVVSGRVDTTEAFWWDEAEALAAAGATDPAFGDPSLPWLIGRLKSLDEEARAEAIRRLRASVGASPLVRRQLTTEELRALDEGGIRIESHTVSHPFLTRCDDERVDDELSGSRASLEAALDRPVEAFAYPDGNADERIRRAVQGCGYRAAFLFDHRVNPSRGLDPFWISRIRVNARASTDRLAVLMSGLHAAMHHLRGRA